MHTISGAVTAATHGASGRDGNTRVVFRRLLRTTATLAVGEFHAILIDRLPPWDQQDELDRRLMALLSDWERPRHR